MALAYQSQTFQNILKDFENITNEEDRIKHLSSLDISPDEFITAVERYKQAKDNEQDIRPYDGGFSGFLTRTGGRFAGETLRGFGGLLDTVLPEDFTNAVKNKFQKEYETLPYEVRENIDEFLDPYHGEGIITRGELTSGDAENAVGHLAAYLNAAGVVKKVIRKGSKKINPTKEYKKDSNTKKFLKEGLYIDAGVSIIDTPEENIINVLYDGYEPSRKYIDAASSFLPIGYVQPDQPESLRYIQAMVNNLAAGGAIGFSLLGAGKLLNFGLKPLKESKLGQWTGEKYQEYFTAYRGVEDQELRDALIKAEFYAPKKYKEAELLSAELKSVGGKELKGNSLFNPNTTKGKENLNKALQNEINPQTGLSYLDELKKASPRTAEVLEKMRTNIDELSEIIQGSVKNSKISAKIGNNLGTYLTRSYRVFDDPLYRKALNEELEIYIKSSGRSAKDVELSSFIKEASDEMQKAGIAAKDIPDTIRSLINYKEDKGLIANIANLGKNKKRLLTKLKLKEGRDDWIRKLWGERTDAFESYLSTVEKLSTSAAEFNFLNEVTEILTRKGLAKKFTPEQKQTVNKLMPVTPGERGPFEADLAIAAADRINSRIGLSVKDFKNPLEALYTSDPLIAGAIREGFELDKPQYGWFYRTFLQAKGLSQASKTVANPSTHVVNISGNTIMMLANGIPLSMLTNLGRATTTLKADIFNVANQNVFSLAKKNDKEVVEYLSDLIENGVIRSNVDVNFLRDTARDLERSGVNGMFSKRVKEGLYPKIIDPGRIFKKTLDKATTVYQAEDDIFKIMHFEQMKKMYGDALGLKGKDLTKFAANMTRDLMPNYSLVPKFFKQVRRTPFGNFLAFPLEMTRVSKNLFKTAYDDYSGRTALKLGLDPIRDADKIAKLKMIGAKRFAGITAAATAGDAIHNASAHLFGITEKDKEAINNIVPRWEMNNNRMFISPIDRDTNGHLGVDYVNLGLIDPFQYPKSIFKFGYALTNGAFDKDISSSDMMRMGTAAYDQILGPYAEPSIITQLAFDSATTIPRELRTTGDRVIYSGKTIGAAFLPPDFQRWWVKREAYEDSMKKRGTEPYGLTDYGYSLSEDDAMTWFGFRSKRLDITSNLRRDLLDAKNNIKDAGLKYKKILQNPNILNDEEGRKEILDAYVYSAKAEKAAQRDAYSRISSYADLGITPSRTYRKETDFRPKVSDNDYVKALTQKRYGALSVDDIATFELILNNIHVPKLDPFTSTSLDSAMKSNSPLVLNSDLRRTIAEIYKKLFKLKVKD